MQRPAGANAFQIVLDLLDAASDAAPISFQLCFTGSTRSDAAAEPGHLNAPPGETRQQIVQLRQFYLETAFTSAGARRKDIEDELGASDYARADRFFEVTLLRRGKLVIEDDKLGAGGGRFGRQFLNLPLTDERSRLRAGPGLNRSAYDYRARAGREFRQFLERFLRVDGGRRRGDSPGHRTTGPFDANQNGAFAGRIRLRRAYASGES